MLSSKGAVELAAATQYFGPPRESAKAFAFAVYKHGEVKTALEKLFRGKCAYCETFYASSQPMDVEHFRPKGAVEGDPDHGGYWWIAMTWENLLPSCIDCNRKRNQVTPTGDISQARLLEETLRFAQSATIGTGKKDSFPLAPGGIRARHAQDALSAERALLLNPCEDEPDDHLTFVSVGDRPISFVLARSYGDANFAGDGNLSLKGATSIHVYGLNRLALVQARTEVLRRLEFLGTLLIDLKVLGDDMARALASGGDQGILSRAARVIDGFADRLLNEMHALSAPEKPYSAMVSAWLRDFADRLERA